MAASVVIESKLIPTASPINKLSPCHHAKGITTININIPSRAPVIASFEMALKAPKDLIEQNQNRQEAITLELLKIDSILKNL